MKRIRTICTVTLMVFSLCNTTLAQRGGPRGMSQGAQSGMSAAGAGGCNQQSNASTDALTTIASSASGTTSVSNLQLQQMLAEYQRMAQMVNALQQQVQSLQSQNQQLLAQLGQSDSTSLLTANANGAQSRQSALGNQAATDNSSTRTNRKRAR